MKAMEFKNVTLSDDGRKRVVQLTHGGTEAVISAHSMLEPVIRTLAEQKPTWKFVSAGLQRERYDDKYSFISAFKFNVFEDGEYLGSIGREYTRKDYKILVQNDRISEKRQRGKGYTTENPDKAVAQIKKMFRRINVTERVTKALAAASNFAHTAVGNHQYKTAQQRSVVEGAARHWVLNEGFGDFMNYVAFAMSPHEKDKILEAHNRWEELSAEMSTLEDVRNKLGTDSTALIVKDSGKYIVRVGDKVNLYDDNDLPVELRGKLGLLKLVDKEHFVSGSGCRVDDDVFVVLLDPQQ